MKEKIYQLKEELYYAELELSELENVYSDIDDDYSSNDEDFDLLIAQQESYCESIKEMIAECEQQIIEERYEKLEDDILKKEERVFKQFQIDHWMLMEFKSPRHSLSPYKKAERNKRKQKDKMKRSFAWTVI